MALSRNKGTSNKDEAKSRLADGNLTIDQAAEFIGVHRSTIERLLNGRTLGYYQVGRRRVIGRRHLQHYLSHVERKSHSDYE
jgi:excisionase family DNA binding protein